MKHLKGTQTEKNLLVSFANESQARSKYLFYAKVAKEEGYEQIAGFFTETADNEEEHAKLFFKYLKTGKALEINATFPAGRIGTTEENLDESIKLETKEANELYVEFERIAREEGFEDVANTFKEVSEVEAEHSKRFKKLLSNIKKGIVFKRDKVVKWQCRECGYIHEGKSAPEKCPACKHPQAYYQLKEENY